MASMQRIRRMLAAVVLALAAGGAVAQTCPQPGARPTAATTLPATELSLRVEVMAQGDLDLGACPQIPARGWARAGSTLALDLPGTRRPVRISVAAACPSVLLVQDAGGRWHGAEAGAALTLPAQPAGVLEIWVGTARPGACPATLHLHPQDTPPAPDRIATPEAQGLPVDWCLNWGANCGQPSADAYCRGLGFAGAASFLQRPVARSLVVGDGRICVSGSDASGRLQCHALAEVVCTAQDSRTQPQPQPPGPVQPPPPPPAPTGACAAALPRDGRGAIVLPADPGDLRIHATPGCVGQMFSVPVVAHAHVMGTVVGGMDGVYAAQSVIAKAAVHAGLLAPGQSGRVVVELVAPQGRFAGGQRNGVQTLTQDAGAPNFGYRFHR